MINYLILFGTLGFGYAWVVARTMEFVFSKIEMTGNIDLDKIIQTEENYRDATGEDLGDMLDIDLI